MHGLWLFAQGAAEGGAPAAGAPASGMSFLLPMIAMFALMYFLVILPSNRQRKQQQTLLSTLKKGDKVVTNAGILGTVVHMKEDVPNEAAEVTLRVDDNTNSRIRVLKSSIASITSRSDETAEVKS